MYIPLHVDATPGIFRTMPTQRGLYIDTVVPDDTSLRCVLYMDVAGGGAYQYTSMHSCNFQGHDVYRGLCRDIVVPVDAPYRCTLYMCTEEGRTLTFAPDAPLHTCTTTEDENL